MPKFERGKVYMHIKSKEIIRPIRDMEIDHYLFIQYKKLTKQEVRGLREK